MLRDYNREKVDGTLYILLHIVTKVYTGFPL